MRPTEPSFVVRWRELERKGPPKCCHTCDWYDTKGQCEKHGMDPPAEFAATEDDCPDWLREVAF